MVWEEGLIWVLVGLVLLVAEILIPGVFLLWIGLAALATGLIDMLIPLGFGAKVSVFVVLLAAGISLALRLRKRHRDVATSSVNAPQDGLVGRIGTLISINPTGARVRVGDSDWQARVDGDLTVGAAVRIEDVDGTTLIVRPV